MKLYGVLISVILPVMHTKQYRQIAVTVTTLQYTSAARGIFHWEGCGQSLKKLETFKVSVSQAGVSGQSTQDAKQNLHFLSKNMPFGGHFT